MSTAISLVLLYGGKSGEHEISLRSAASILAHLDTTRYRVTPIGMDKSGRFYINNYDELLDYPASLPVTTRTSRPLDSLVSNGRLAVDAEVVFPAVHGPLYEDGCLQGLLNLADTAYVGCDVLSSAIGMDKDISRRLAAEQGIKSARYRVVSSNLSAADKDAVCSQAAAELGWPLFVKPAAMGSSVGIHKVFNQADLMRAVNDASRFDHEILIEAFIAGREIELAVLENIHPSEPPKVSMPGEIKVCHADGFYSYAAKYIESDSTTLCIPAQMTDEMTCRLQTAASVIFKALKCKGLARIDFFYNEEEDEIYFNEINTLPGFTTISMYPKLWEASGVSYQALLNELIDIAQAHQQQRRAIITHYQ